MRNRKPQEQGILIRINQQREKIEEEIRAIETNQEEKIIVMREQGMEVRKNKSVQQKLMIYLKVIDLQNNLRKITKITRITKE